MEDSRPGRVITPQTSGDDGGQTPAAPDPMPTGAPEPERPPEEMPAPPPPPNAPGETAAAVNSAETPAANWQFHAESAADPSHPGGPALPEQLTWTASEFIAHEKSAGWFGLLALGTALVAAGVYFLTRDKLTTGIIVFAAICLGVYSVRKPRVQTYTMFDYGLKVGQKLYTFQGFKSFSIAEEGAIASIVFMPLKRFMPPLTIYVAPDMEEQIVGFLAQLLPLEQHRQDAVDGLLKRIRF
jgi:hypothetical protein